MKLNSLQPGQKSCYVSAAQGARGGRWPVISIRVMAVSECARARVCHVKHSVGLMISVRGGECVRLCDVESNVSVRWMFLFRRAG